MSQRSGAGEAGTRRQPDKSGALPKSSSLFAVPSLGRAFPLPLPSMRGVAAMLSERVEDAYVSMQVLPRSRALPSSLPPPYFPLSLYTFFSRSLPRSLSLSLPLSLPLSLFRVLNNAGQIYGKDAYMIIIDI